MNSELFYPLNLCWKKIFKFIWVKALKIRIRCKPIYNRFVCDKIQRYVYNLKAANPSTEYPSDAWTSLKKKTILVRFFIPIDFINLLNRIWKLKHNNILSTLSESGRILLDVDYRCRCFRKHPREQRAVTHPSVRIRSFFAIIFCRNHNVICLLLS